MTAVESGGLGREREIRRVRGKEIRVSRNAVIVGPAPEGIGMHGEMAGAGIEQRGAFEAVVDGRCRRPRLDVDAALLVRTPRQRLVDSRGRTGGRTGPPPKGRLRDATVGAAPA